MNKKILAICGSIRAKSSNLSILKLIAEMMPEGIDYEIYNGLAGLPHFNPDSDTDTPPGEVRLFREKIKVADGILFCTPEYAFGVPGVLKNALDWTVSSSEIVYKHVAVITASSSGEKAHASLLQTLTAISTKFTEKETLLISFIRSKMNAEGKFIHAETGEAIKSLVETFISEISRADELI